MAALGMIEVYGYTTSIVVADVVAKTADVKVVAIDKNKPANADACPVPLVMVVKFVGRQIKKSRQISRIKKILKKYLKIKGEKTHE